MKDVCDSLFCVHRKRTSYSPGLAGILSDMAGCMSIELFFAGKKPQLQGAGLGLGVSIAQLHVAVSRVL